MDSKNKYIPKNKKSWLEEIADKYSRSNTDDPRDFPSMVENYDLMIGNLDLDRLNKTFNPMELDQAKIDIITEDQVIPVIAPSINTLIGEVYDRNIDFRAFVANPDAVSEKEKNIKKLYNEKLRKIIVDKANASEEELQMQLNKLNQWKTYEAQDIRERAANHIIKDGIERLDFQRKTKEGWKDIIANVNEIYKFEIVNGNVEMTNLHPLNVKVFGLPNNGNIHEAEAICYERYMSYSEIIAGYNLKKSEIDSILDKDGEQIGGEAGVVVFHREEDAVTDENGELVLDPVSNKFFTNDDWQGRDGDKILVKTVYFKALRKVNVLKYIDDRGDEQTKIVSGDYKPMKEEGESVKTDYFPEYWEITKIMNDLYVNGKACDVQMRDSNNPKKVYAPIVGKILKDGNRVKKSIIDLLRPIQYQWTAFEKRLQLLWTRNHGKLVRLDVSKIPKKYGVDVNLFLAWIQSYGIILEDPFNEANRGVPAGQYGSTVGTVDAELSSSIQMALNYMIYLRELADETVGVTRQRRGNLMASDGLGTTQESISRSLKITEEIFQEHHSLQKVLLQYVLEYTKQTLITGENKKLQYITDDMISHMYEVDPDVLKGTDYGIFINNSRKQFELEQVFIQLAHAAMQNGVIGLSQIMELYNTNSMSTRISKLKLAEEESKLREQETQKQQQEHDKKMLEKQQELKDKEMSHEIELQRMKDKTDVLVAQIQAQAKVDVENIQTDQKSEEMQTKKQIEQDKTVYNYKNTKSN